LTDTKKANAKKIRGITERRFKNETTTNIPNRYFNYAVFLDMGYVFV